MLFKEIHLYGRIFMNCLQNSRSEFIAKVGLMHRQIVEIDEALQILKNSRDLLLDMSQKSGKDFDGESDFIRRLGQCRSSQAPELDFSLLQSIF